MDQKFSTLLSKGVSRIIDQKHLEERLERGDVLRVKFGIDPTGTIVHLGHIVHKMSKTGGNCIAVDMPANDMFVKLMEVKDELILEFFRLTTLMTNEEVDMVGERLKAGEHPKDIKLELARTVVTMYHGIEAAIEAQAYFEKVLTNGVMPSEDEMPKAYLESGLGIISVVKEL